MTPVLNTARSGMELQGKRVATAAHNIVTARATAADGERPGAGQAPLTAQRVEAVSVAQGGVRGALLPPATPPGSLRAGNQASDEEPGGFLAPDISEEAEVSTLLQARRAYSANIRSFNAGADLLGEELDVET